MTLRVVVALAAVMLADFGAGQVGDQRPQTPEERRDVKLPNGKRQSDEILKDEYKKNLDDAAELLKLSEELKAELEKNEAFVLSLTAIKKTEDIEKVAKRIRGRLKRY